MDEPQVQLPRRRRWSMGYLGLALAVVVGALIGLGTFTFGYAEGFSYFSTDPRACVNCHIMNSQFDSWQKSSHHTVATCVDCHLPHDFVPKYIAKAENGWNHSWAFTFQDFPEPIRMTPRNQEILQENCVGCHAATTHEMFPGVDLDALETLSCVHCHSNVGHGPHLGLGRAYPMDDE